MKKKLFSLALAAVMTVASVVTAFAATEEKAMYELKNAYTLDGNATTVEAMDNPLLGVTTDKVIIEFSVTSEQQFAAWPMVAAFYNVDDAGAPVGAATLNYWPKIEVNKFTDPNEFCSVGTGEAANGGTIYADSHCDGKPHTYKYEITNSAVVITVDGTVVDTKYGYGDGAQSDAACAAMVFDYVKTAEKFALGAGNNLFNWGELTGTLNSFKISAVVEKPVTPPAGENPPAGGNGGNGGAQPTADMAPVVAVVALAAVAAVVVLKKRNVTE